MAKPCWFTHGGWKMEPQAHKIRLCDESKQKIDTQIVFGGKNV